MINMYKLFVYIVSIICKIFKNVDKQSQSITVQQSPTPDDKIVSISSGST